MANAVILPPVVLPKLVIDKSINPQIGVVQSLGPKLYWDFRFPYDVTTNTILYKESSRINPVTTVGDKIGSATNLGYGGFVPLQSATLSRAVYNGPSIGGTLDGVDDGAAQFLSLTRPLTVWVDYLSTMSNVTVGGIYGFQTGGGGIILRADSNANYTIIEDDGNGGAGDSVSYSSAALSRINNAYVSLIATHTLAAVTLEQNGSTIIGPSVGSNDPQNISFLAAGSDFATFLAGNIRRICVFTRTLTAAEKSTLNGLV